MQAFGLHQEGINYKARSHYMQCLSLAPTLTRTTKDSLITCKLFVPIWPDLVIAWGCA